MDCFFVGVQDMFSTRKCRYQHYQSRLRQMEIRDQCIQHLETISGIYEYLSIVTAGLSPDNTRNAYDAPAHFLPSPGGKSLIPHVRSHKRS